MTKDAVIDPTADATSRARSSSWPDRARFVGDPAHTGPIYRGILRWAGWLVRNYHRVEVRGEVFPSEAPVLLVQNHTNGLCDAYPLMTSTVRPIRILVKYKLLKLPVIGWMLRRMDAVPMYRKKDGVDTRQNQKSFEAIDRALTERSVIALFPEGESLNSIGIRELRSGVARMAISAIEAGGEDLGLVIVPIGVTYEDRDRWRTLASSLIGRPLDVAAVLREGGGEDTRTQVRRLMAEIRAALEALVLHAETPEEHATACALERIAPRGDAPIGLRRKDALARIRAHAEPNATSHAAAVRELGARLDAARLDGDQVLAPRPGIAPLVRAALIDVPVFLVSLIAWGVPMISSVSVARLRRSPDKKVTLRELFANAGFLVWVPALLLFLHAGYGGPGVAAGALLFALAIPTFSGTVDRLIEARRVLARRALRSSSGDDAIVEQIVALRRAYGYGPDSQAIRSSGPGAGRDVT